MEILGYKIRESISGDETVFRIKRNASNFGVKVKTDRLDRKQIYIMAKLTIQQDIVKCIVLNDSSLDKGKYLLVPTSQYKKALSENSNQTIIPTRWLDKVNGGKEETVFTNNEEALKLY